MKEQYEKPAELYDGLRLHQNENTGGCSPRVLDALARLTRQNLAYYPPYAEATEACARHLGVAVDRVMLVNGLDEGIMSAAIAYLRHAGSGLFRAVVPEPAFEIFRFDTAAAGGRLVQVMPKPDFSFALDEVLAAITPATRVVFLTNPNNPTGVSAPFEAIRAIAAAVPAQAIVFVDEAYADFAGRSFIPELSAFPNVIVGRTFSKAYGLAAIRIGALVGAPAVLDPIRYATPVYSVNIAAIVALQAALSDQDYVNDYLQQVKESKALLYAACDAWGWLLAERCQLRAGASGSASTLSPARRARRVFAQSIDGAGCEGCLRIATGIVEHTKRGIAVIEEVPVRGVIDRRTTETSIALTIGPKARAGISQHGHPFPGSHARAVRASWRVRPRSLPSAISTSISITRSRISHRAGRGGRLPAQTGRGINRGLLVMPMDDAGVAAIDSVTAACRR